VTESLARLTAALSRSYRIERELGQGGMATVYLAHDLKHQRSVAIKVLRPELAAVIGAERFLREIKTIATLQHPHILGLIDSGEVNGTAYYVMPFVEGESLRDRLTREKQLPIADAVRIATEVAAALDYAHRHGVIHRDIKPENVLLHDGSALVADFGIALAVSSGGSTRMTETGMSLGTPHYMSPEQAMGEREITARSDVYALGAMTYEMLVGEPPFTGPTAQAIIAKVMTGEPAPLTAQRKSVPPAVEGAVLTALEKLPADRFASAAEFAAALAGTMSTRAMSRAVPPAGPWRRVALASVAVALLCATLAAWGWLRHPVLPVTRVRMSFPAAERIQVAATRRFALSRDGTRLVYIGPDSSGTQLWVRSMNSLQGRPLPGTSGAQAPFFSPDGRSVGFFTGNPGDLKVVSVDGGPIQMVVRDSAYPWGGDWTADGKLYFSGAGLTIHRVAAGGGKAERISTRDTAQGVTEHDWPEVLPNGKGALVQLWHTSFSDTEIGVLDFATGRVRPILKGAYARYLRTGHILYCGVDGTLLAVRFDLGRMEPTGAPTTVTDQVLMDLTSGAAQFAVSESGTLLYLEGGANGSEQLVWVGRDGKVAPVDSSWTGSFTSPALSPDDSRLAVSILAGNGQHLWIKQLNTGPLTRLTFAGDENWRPAWAPDGRRLALISNRGGRRQIWIQRADGSAEAESLSVSPRPIDEVTWVPDGRGVAFRVRLSDDVNRDIFSRGLGADTVTRVLVGSRFSESAPDLSPDGRWFTYVSDESGRSEVYVRQFADPGAGKWQVSGDGGSEPLWAHSGRELFYRTRRGDMMAAEVVPGATFSTRPPRLLFRAPDMKIDPNHRAYDVSRDDRRFLMVRGANSDAAELVLVLNWFEELNGRVER